MIKFLLALGKVMLNGLKNKILKHFWNKSFFHYAWISGLYSILNIFLLWVFIDILGVPTVVSGVIVVGGTFILRYLLFKWSKIV